MPGRKGEVMAEITFSSRIVSCPTGSHIIIPHYYIFSDVLVVDPVRPLEIVNQKHLQNVHFFSYPKLAALYSLVLLFNTANNIVNH